MTKPIVTAVFFSGCIISAISHAQTVDGEMPDYERTDYLPFWTDLDDDCRDTRNEVLAIESVIAPTFDESGCHVIAGEWQDPFSGEIFNDPGELYIEHLVPLKEAHVSGAFAWESSKKLSFSNDLLLSEALVAVSASTSSARASRDPAEWLPPNAEYQCEYVQDWVRIKTRNGLAMDAIERYAIEQVMGGSIETSVPQESSGWDAIDQEPSAAVFGLGVRKQNRCNYTSDALPSDQIDVNISLQPDPAHTDQSAAVYLVAEMNGALFSITPAAAFVPWNGDLSALIPMHDDLMLRESIDFTVFQGALNAELVFNLFVGYETAEGDFVYSAQPLPFVVAE